MPRVEKSYGPFPKFGKEYHLFLIIVLSFSTTLGMIFLICILDHLWNYHFDPISIFLFCGNWLICLIYKTKFVLHKPYYLHVNILAQDDRTFRERKDKTVDITY